MSASPEWIRLIAFIGLLCLFAAIETGLPRRRRLQTRRRRWLTNLGMGVIDTLAIRLLGPVVAVGAAGWAASLGYGALNLTDWPLWLEFGLAFLVLDLAIYGQHVATHKVPILWRLHRVHHADRDIDVTTALRFHPVEILLSMLWKCAVVIALGASVWAVIIFEIVLNGTAMFNHMNARLPAALDKVLRRFVVTPDMHRVHHSVRPDETNSNFGFNLPWWDHIFRTYRSQPDKGHEAMTIGLSEYQTDHPGRFGWSLLLPFKQ